jgi:hypothetical protein
VTIDLLPDDVLLSVFDCHVDEATDVEGWRTLVHVCRRWQNIVFGSPRRLHLRIAFTNKSHVREKLDIWPCLPIVVSGYCDSATCLDNIKAALEHGDRICQIELMINPRKIPVNDVFAALEKPFPALTDLDLSQWPFINIPGHLDPLKFLGGSSHLRSLSLGGIAIPQFPALLASSMDLNNLHLHDIPHYGYLTPDAMAAALSALTSLETLSLRFASGQSRPDLANKESRHPLQRSVIPSLLCFDFEGVNEYLEALVSRIDTPVLDRLGITIFRAPTFDTTQLLWLLSRIPKMQEFDKVCMKLTYPEVWTDFSSSDLSTLRLGISSNEPERHFLCLIQLFGLPFNPLPTLESLYIVACPPSQYQWDRIENAQWLELLRPFVAVKNLHLSKEVARRIAPALEELVGERATDVFPTLQNVFLEEEAPQTGYIYRDMITRFATARRLSGHPIQISVYHY